MSGRREYVAIVDRFGRVVATPAVWDSFAAYCVAYNRHLARDGRRAMIIDDEAKQALEDGTACEGELPGSTDF